MSAVRIIHLQINPSLLSRKHCASFLRPPKLLLATNLVSQSRTQQQSLSSPPKRLFSSSVTKCSTNSTFSYHISASFSDKKKPLDPARNVYTHDQTNGITKRFLELPLKERKLLRPKSGQDSFFVSKINETGHTALGVVDGVGGWEASGVDPADFAHSLCEYMANAAAEFPREFGKYGEKSLHPQDLLDVGTQKVMQDQSVHAGGSTACVATVSSTGVLDVANLGDSGYAHLTPFRLSSLSPPQTHAFNTPFQLSKMPPRMLEQMALFGSSKPYAETAADAAVTSHKLSHGDILVFATDGVWDNLSPQDMLQIVSRVMLSTGAWKDPDMGSAGAADDLRDIADEASQRFAGSRSMKAATNGAGKMNGSGEIAEIRGLSAIIATAITHEAKAASLDRKRDGPFAKEVQKRYPEENWTGGKQDDICTVVAVVVRDD